MSAKKALVMAGRFLTNKEIRFSYLAKIGFYNKMSDEKYLSRLFEYSLGYKLNLKDPRTFNEKNQYLKIYGRKDSYTELADKYLVKDIVGKAIGYEHVIKTIDSWDNAGDIDLDSLPDKFVLKCNHTSSTGVIICKDKSKLDRDKVVAEMDKAMHTDYSYYRREHVYSRIKRKIFAEEFISDPSGRDIDDYKVFVFNGRAQFVQVDFDRFTDHHRNFYDREWNYVPFTTCYPTNPDHKVEKPAQLEELLRLAEELAQKTVGDIPFVRMDFYIVGERILFGEITFYHGAGIERFYPEEYDRKLGDMIKL